MSLVNMGGVMVGEPGTKKLAWYYHRDIGEYPSIEQQVKEAQAHNREFYSSSSHNPVQLYTFEEDCGHTQPLDDEKYADIDDLRDEWLESLGLTMKNPYERASTMYWAYWDLWNRNARRFSTVNPLAYEFDEAQGEWEDSHSGNVCLLSPSGEKACSYCNADDLDYGEGVSEPYCRLNADLKEAEDEFWWRASNEWSKE